MPDPANLPHDPDPLARLVREVPTWDVQREALAYVLYSCILDGALRVEQAEEAKILSHNRDGWNKDGRYRVRAPLPKALCRWRYEMVTLPDPKADLAPYLSELVLGPPPLIELLPDVLSIYPPFTIVSDHVRELITDLDIDGSYFVPAKLSVEGGGAVPGSWWHWIPRRRLTLMKEGERIKGLMPFSGIMADPYLAWQLVHDPDARNFVSDLPVWGAGAGFGFGPIAFNRSTFAALKAAGITGLVESIAPSGYDLNDHESVGHFV
jgi:hypothetical protein